MKKMDEEYEEDEDIENETKITILTLGDVEVGKTSLVLKYIDDTFSEKYMTTIGIDFKDKYLIKNGKNFKISFVHPSSKFSNQNLINLECDGIIFLYDTTNEKSFDDISKYIENFQDKKGKNFPMILLGNKIDKIGDRKISKEAGEELAKTKGINFSEISVKEGTNVNKAVNSLIDQIFETNPKLKDNIENAPMLNENKKGDKKDNSDPCPCCSIF